MASFLYWKNKIYHQTDFLVCDEEIWYSDLFFFWESYVYQLLKFLCLMVCQTFVGYLMQKPSL